ncbi:DUF1493 family protein [Pseudomonas gingeri]|uniref:DUF1493 family protein n=1 Tax=Pseudomonas gingeri TaxID=117681 RepID=A0A7Y8CLH7_9PSED|nr:DUF1493 family protein [Pseudomonas gingeri]NWB25673.1 DUF1493 family protein [Pseudomonas gingeri]NWC35136.1 DUF1493 family protein [Pseudomonas gingeri]
MILASSLPDTELMKQLIELLDDEIGLPEHKSVGLHTAINLDLGCDGKDASELMDALEERFILDLVDFDPYRYFEPEGFDVFAKRRTKVRSRKVALTIGMLYQAIRQKHWNTAELERLVEKRV